MLLLNRHERDPFGRATEKSVREKQKKKEEVKEEMTLLRFAYRPHEYQQLICGGFARRSIVNFTYSFESFTSSLHSLRHFFFTPLKILFGL